MPFRFAERVHLQNSLNQNITVVANIHTLIEKDHLGDCSVLRRTVLRDWLFDNLSGNHLQSHLTLKMASAQVVETSVISNSPSQDSNHPDDFFSIKECYSWVQTIFLVANIYYSKPYGPASQESIACWIRQTMKAAGVITNVLKLHSVRSTSTTAAKLGEVPKDEMTEVAGWQSDSMFSKFYCKPVVNWILVALQMESWSTFLST